MRISLLLTLALAAMGCGQNKAVILASSSYTQAGAIGTQAADDFFICVSRVKLQAEDDSYQGGDGSNEIKFEPGLIDVSNGKSATWGSVDLPEGFKLKKIFVKVHKDKTLCGQEYSVKFGDLETSQDIEFKWKFDPSIELDAQDTIVLKLDEVVTALRTAAAGNELKGKIESVEGSASR